MHKGDLKNVCMLILLDAMTVKLIGENIQTGQEHIFLSSSVALVL